MAYAAVVSLLQILKQILHSTDDQTSKPLIESLYGKLCSLQSSLQNIFPAPKFTWIATNDLETRIRYTVYRAQDTIEKSLIACQSLSSSESLVFLQETIAEVDSIMKTSKEIEVSIKEDWMRGRDLLESENNALPSVFSTNWSRDHIVGKDRNLENLKFMFKASSFLKVISIVGMVGIGKTTLAKCIYDDPDIRKLFYYRAWVTVSPEYRVEGVLLSLLKGEIRWGKGFIGDASMSCEELAITLRQLLGHMRYLLVIDDVWDRDVWDKISKYFPDDENGSRIIVTTRNANLASYACSDEDDYMIRDPFLDNDESWNLLRKVVFTNGSESCSSGPLEKIGRKIRSPRTAKGFH